MRLVFLSLLLLTIAYLAFLSADLSAKRDAASQQAADNQIKIKALENAFKTNQLKQEKAYAEQAERVKKFEEFYRAQLIELEKLETSVKSFQKPNVSDSLREEVKLQGEKLEELSAALKKGQDELLSLESNVSEADPGYSEEERQHLSALNSEIEEHRQAVSKLNEKFQAMKSNQLIHDDNQISELQVQIADEKNKIASIDVEMKSIVLGTRERMVESFAAKRKQLNSSRVALHNLSEKFQTQRAELERVEAEYNQSKKDFEGQIKEHDLQQKKLELLKQRVTDLKVQLDSEKKVLVDLKPEDYSAQKNSPPSSSSSHSTDLK